MDSVLSLLGLAKKAGRIELGEEAVGATARAHGARLILLAKDAATNTVRRAQRYAEEGACLIAEIPADKNALGGAVGRASCAVLVLTDVGFADAVAKKLAALDEARYGELASRLSRKAGRAAQRRREQARRDQKSRRDRGR